MVTSVVRPAGPSLAVATLLLCFLLPTSTRQQSIAAPVEGMFPDAPVAATGEAGEGWADPEGHDARARQALPGDQATAIPSAAGFLEVGRIRYPPALTTGPGFQAFEGEAAVVVVTSESGLLTFDLRTGSLLHEETVGQTPGTGKNPLEVSLGGHGSRRRLVISYPRQTSYNTPMRVYDASDPRRLVLLASAENCGSGAVVEAAGRAAFGYGDFCGHLFDLDSGATLQPFERGIYRAAWGGGEGLAPVLAYVSQRSYKDPHVLSTWKVLDPAAPEAMASVVLPGYVEQLFVDMNGTLLVLTMADGFQVRDARTGELLSEVRDLSFPRHLVLAEGGGGKVVAVAYPGAVDLFDVKDPQAPERIGQVSLNLYNDSLNGPYLNTRQPMVPARERPWLVLAVPDPPELVVVDIRDGSILGRWEAGPAQPAAVTLDEGAPGGPIAGLLSLRAIYDEVLVPGGTAHLDALSLALAERPEHLSRYERVTPQQIVQSAVFDGHLVASVDLAHNAIVVSDAADGRQVAAGGLSFQSFVPSSYDQHVAAAGKTVAAGGRLGFEVFEISEPDLVSRARLVWPYQEGYLQDLKVLPGGAAVALIGATRLETVLPDGRRGRLDLPLGATSMELHPDGSRVLLSPASVWSYDPYGASLVDLGDPASPTLLWSTAPGVKFANFVRGGAAVSAAYSQGWDFYPLLLDTETGAPLGEAGPSNPFFFYWGPGTAFGEGTAARMVYWRWTYSGWKSVLYDMSRDTPGWIAESPEYFDEPGYAPRADGGAFYELRRGYTSVEFNPVLLGGADGSYTDFGTAPLSELQTLRHGFLVGKTPRPYNELRELTVVRDPAMNRPPVPAAGEDRSLECAGPTGTPAILDGSRSTDPDSTPGTADDISSFTWFLDGKPAGTEPIVEASLPVGEHGAELVVRDRLGLEGRAEVAIRVVDTTPPSGHLTAPPPGSCHGPDSLPVHVEDSFADSCDPDLERSYDPGPGPIYDEHGDHVVLVTAGDRSGNAASDSVAFTIDRIPPVVEILSPPAGVSLPSALPFSIAFRTHDNDGATGDVLHEVVRLDGCTIYDGFAYGDQDGLLGDETLVLDLTELCRISKLCGIDRLQESEIRIEARDCGGNVGFAARRLRGSLALRPGLCAQ